MMGLLRQKLFRVVAEVYMLRSNVSSFRVKVKTGQILSSDIPLPKIQCVTGANAKEHEKSETKHLGSSMPKTNKERAWLKSMEQKLIEEY